MKSKHLRFTTTVKLRTFGSRLRYFVGAVFAVCALLLVVSPLANAQATGQATISGIVTDTSGSVIANARLTITNVQTGVSADSVTNATGYFVVKGLNPGIYKVSVASAGFRTLLREGITVEADSTVNLPLRLATGSVTETVTVTGDAAQLNTESGSSGQILTTRQVQSLPASGSNPAWLLEMAPGVQSWLNQTSSTDGTLSWNGPSNFASLGNRDVNEYSLDGAPNMQARNNAVNPTGDETGEMKLDVVALDASVGHTMGANITQTTKAGTNSLHGSFRESYQNKRWSAKNHLQGLNYKFQEMQSGCNGSHAAVPVPNSSYTAAMTCLGVENTFGWPGTHENNGAMSIGGPVYIPKVFDGRKKLFFFVSILDDVLNGTGSRTVSIPTLLERGGNFSDLPQQTTNIPSAYTSQCGAAAYFGQYQIFDPLSVTLSNGVPSRTPFCGNIIPTNRIGPGSSSQMVTLYNSLLPTPTNGSTTGNNFTITTNAPQTYRSFTGRGDYSPSSKDNIFMRYGRADYTNTASGFAVGDVDVQTGPRWIDLASIGWNHVFSPTTDLAVTVGGTNFRQACCFYPGYDRYKPSSVGLPSYLDAYAGKRAELPVLNVNNYQQIGAVDNSTGYFRTLAFRGTLTHVQGKHTINLGAEYRLQHSSQGVEGNLSGTYSFDDTYTQQNNGTDPTYSQSNTGLAYAAFLLGIPTNSSVSSQPAFAISSPYAGFFVGDTWHVTPKLTFIPGIRYEWESGIVENTNSMIVGWNPNAALPIAAAANTAYQSALANATPQQQAVLPASLTIQGGPLYAGVNGASKQQWRSSNRVLPRIAVAYQLTPNTVLRGGYGMFSDTLNALNPSIDQDGFNAQTNTPSSTTFGTNFSPGVSPLANPFPSGINPPVGSTAGSMFYAGGNPNIYDQNRKPARAQRGEFSVQRQFGSSTLVEARYVINYTSDITLGKNYTPIPSSFYAGGQQPNSAPNALLSSQIANPFNISNFGSLQTTDPAAYNLMQTNGFFLAQNINISDLVRAYPQMNGLTLNQSIGQSHFQELQLNVTERFNRGLTLMAAFQVNDQHDRDYFKNSFDASPSWEPSNFSTPERLSVEAVYDLPFGRGRKWASSGWKSALFGGFQVSTSYEAQQGALIDFGNLFYIGNTDQIKIKHPIYVNDQATGGSNYIQWLNLGNVVATPTVVNGVVTCTYTGTGFVTNSQCQPTGFNLRAFPKRVNSVRFMGWNDANINVQREFRLSETVKLQTRIEAYNAFNRQTLWNPGCCGNPSDPNFGRINWEGWPGTNGRWIMIQGAVRF